ncbi:MAG: 4-(cytidine 5'-diphospho)-2-C-methyl-D-erythritol kinase [Lentisphaeria bacterium]|nr:4-(cytidine 5'-diphospho)-2-C-methyl-D-erythritol kinase [Lentisphaeria bacterium]
MDTHLRRTPGKINLLLRVTGRTANGFHELRTLFHAVPEAADEIAVDFDAPPGIAVRCSLPGVPENEENIVWRAAERFARLRGIEPCWAFEIGKKIPVAAGMGGGSSDAGCVLALLDRRFPGLPREELLRCAISVGADVPFFLDPGDAAARGIGEKLEKLSPLPMPPLLIVSPGFPVSAAWAYRHLERMTPPEQAEAELAALEKALRRKDFPAAAALCANDLEHALFAKFPLLAMLGSALEEAGALCVHVSGSGPVLFALFDSVGKRHEAAGRLGEADFAGAGIEVMECAER